MKYKKHIVALTCGLFSVIGQAEQQGSLLDFSQNNILKLDGDISSAAIFVKDEANIKGSADRYIVAETQVANKKVRYILNKNKNWEVWTGAGTRKPEPTAEGGIGDFNFNFNGIGSSTSSYKIYQIIASKGTNPYESKNWRPTHDEKSLKQLVIKASSSSNIAPIKNPLNNVGQNIANTSVSTTKYFRPTLSERVLGDKYKYVVNSKAKWDQISDLGRKRETLYWSGSKNTAELLDTNGARIDQIWNHSFSPEGARGLTIAEPLTSIHITGYPGCAGISNLETHPRVCGENNPSILNASEVFSQRWYRPKNLDANSYQGLRKSDIKYDMFASVDIFNIMKLGSVSANVRKNMKPILFEMSVSKIPGDFSDMACKSVGKIKYHSSPTVHLTEKGMGSYFTLTEACKIDSTEMEHYYINVRAVNIDTKLGVVNKSLCDANAKCKFELTTSLGR